MSELIRIQSAYAAAAKMIGATQTLFDSLLNAFR
jgi:flagellar hook-associated protein FlgK